jgi:hypothetical protein
VDEDDIALALSPLTLNPKQPSAQPDYQVASSVLGQRVPDLKPHACRLSGNCQLGGISFDIRIVYHLAADNTSRRGRTTSAS